MIQHLVHDAHHWAFCPDCLSDVPCANFDARCWKHRLVRHGPGRNGPTCPQVESQEQARGVDAPPWLDATRGSVGP